MSEQILGTNGMVEQPKQRRYTQGQGWVLVRTWHGPQSQAEAFENELLEGQNPPVSIETTMGVPAIISATYPLRGPEYETQESQDEDSSAVWELVAEQIEKDIRVHGYFNKSDFTPPVMEQIDKAIREGVAGQYQWPSQAMEDYLRHRLRGIDSWVTWYYRVRKTITTSSYSEIKLDFIQPTKTPGNVVLWQDIGVPKTAKFSQPSIRIYDRDNDAFVLKPLQEWLVCAPSVTFDRRNKKWTLSREWIGAEKISRVLYGGAASWNP